MGDAGSTAFVNYSRLFNLLDLDNDKTITIDEWAITLRRHVGIQQGEASDEELEHAFRLIDIDEDGRITLREFAAYSRGASVSTAARGKADNTKKKKKVGRRWHPHTPAS